MDPKLEQEIGRRQESNRVLVQLISDMVESQPDLRFHQILHSIGVEKQLDIGVTQDLFYEESVKTLERVSETIEKIK
jgi:hypothetical protein